MGFFDGILSAKRQRRACREYVKRYQLITAMHQAASDRWNEALVSHLDVAANSSAEDFLTLEAAKERYLTAQSLVAACTELTKLDLPLAGRNSAQATTKWIAIYFQRSERDYDHYMNGTPYEDQGLEEAERHASAEAISSMVAVAETAGINTSERSRYLFEAVNVVRRTFQLSRLTPEIWNEVITPSNPHYGAFFKSYEGHQRT